MTSGRIHRLAWLGWIAAACGQSIGAGPQLEAVAPPAVRDPPNGSAVQILGSGFKVRSQVDVDQGRWGGSAEGFVLELQGGSRRVRLESVTWLGSNRLSARVPGGTPLGFYDLGLTDGWGRSATLSRALEVVGPDPLNDGGAPDSGTEQDAGPRDGGASDSGPADGGPDDGGFADGGLLDGGAPDSGSVDGGPGDGGFADGGLLDGGAPDSGSADGGPGDGGFTDGGPVDAGPACAAPALIVIHVDPVNGSDTTGAGTALLPYRTITHALAVLLPLPGTEIFVHPGTLAVGGGGEALPLTLPREVRVVGDAVSPPVLSPTTGPGFILSAPCSGVAYFVLMGSGAGDGIHVEPGSDVTTTLDHVTVTRMAGAGIVVENPLGAPTGGTLTLGSGVSSKFNGSTGTPNSGLVVQHNGRASITVLPSEQPAFFSKNTGSGIDIRDVGSILINGSGSAGMVHLTANVLAGIQIAQSPGLGAPGCDLGGIQASGNVDGIRLIAGSAVRVRQCVCQSNVTGIHLTYNAATGDGVSGIDLGTTADPGANALQFAAPTSANTGAGLCVELGPSNQTLRAEGNLFSRLDCRLPGGGTLTRASTCGGAVDLGNSGATVVDVLTCQ